MPDEKHGPPKRKLSPAQRVFVEEFGIPLDYAAAERAQKEGITTVRFVGVRRRRGGDTEPPQRH